MMINSDIISAYNDVWLKRTTPLFARFAHWESSVLKSFNDHPRYCTPAALYLNQLDTWYMDWLGIVFIVINDWQTSSSSSSSSWLPPLCVSHSLPVRLWGVWDHLVLSFVLWLGTGWLVLSGAVSKDGRTELFSPPIGGGTPPIDVNTHPQTVLPPLGVCVLF